MRKMISYATFLFIIIIITGVNIEGAGGIKVDTNYWDFGHVKEGQIVEHSFLVENASDKELIIEKVYTTCGCTTTEISSVAIAPKNNATLKVSYNSKGKSRGPDTKDIYIISNDTFVPKTKITISAYVIDSHEKKAEVSQVPTISSDELYSHINKGENIAIFDAREENEYIERHIPGAIWFPKSKFDRSDKETLAKLDGIDRELLLVSYCGAGHRSSYVTKKLREKGYNAFNLDGISFWEEKGYPLVRGPKLPPSEEPSIIHLEEAYEHYYFLFKDIVWIDVRNIDDYKRGHIKEALGIPLSELELRLNEIPSDKEIVFYCEGTWEGGKCDASMSAGRILIKNGFKQGRIKVFEDGYGAWENAGYPIERRHND